MSTSNLQNIISSPTSRSINDVFNTINTDINVLYNTATTNVSFINTVSDFPSGRVVAGIVPPVIKLVDNKSYVITSIINTNGAIISGGINTPIHGYSSENCWLEGSIPSGYALINSSHSLPLFNITLSASGTNVKLLNLDATNNANQALDWLGVNLRNAKIGLIKNYTNFVINSTLATDLKGGFEFDGSIGTVSFLQCLFSNMTVTGESYIKLLPTANVTRRFRMFYSSMVVPNSVTGVAVVSGATVPIESFIFDNVNFSGSNEANYLAGLNYLNNESLIKECKGVTNSNSIGQMYMSGNATTTTIANTTDYVKVAGTTTANALNQKFSHSNNKLTYTGALTNSFEVICTLSATAGTNNQVYFAIYKNGVLDTSSITIATTSGTGRAENFIVTWFGTLSQNDYIEVFCRNASATTNILTTNLNLIIKAVG